MPIGLSPKNRVDVYLDTDMEDFPDAAKRPAFVCKFITCEDFIPLEDLIEKARAENDNAKCLSTLREAAAIGIVGWKNMGEAGDFAPEKLTKILAVPEMWELIFKMQKATRLEIDARKKSALERASGTAGSAPSALPAPMAAA